MAAKLRVRKLAKRLGCTPKQVLDVLHQLGEIRYRSQSDMLPPELTARVERALELAGLAAPPKPKRVPEPKAPEGPPPPPPMPRHLREARAAAAAAAASPAPPSEAAPEPPAPPEASPPEVEPAPVEPAAAAPAPAEPVSAEPAPEPAPEVVDEPVAPEPTPAEPTPEELAEQVAQLAGQLKELEATLETVRKEAADAKALQQIAIDRLLPSEMRVHELQEELKASRAQGQEEVDLLQQRLNQAEAALQTVTVAEVAPTLQPGGLRSPDEIGRLFAVLLGSEWAERTLEHLRLLQGDRLRRLVEQKIVLHCGDPTHTLPEGRLGLRVTPPNRCQICGGRELVAAAEGLVLKCRPRNIRRMLLVGGDAMDAAELGRALSGRVDVIWVSPNATPTPAEVEQQIEQHHLAVLWTGGGATHLVAQRYAGQPRVIEADASGLQGLLRQVSEHI